jgi:hypothetical protein
VTEHASIGAAHLEHAVQRAQVGPAPLRSRFTPGLRRIAAVVSPDSHTIFVRPALRTRIFPGPAAGAPRFTGRSACPRTVELARRVLGARVARPGPGRCEGPIRVARLDGAGRDRSGERDKTCRAPGFGQSAETGRFLKEDSHVGSRIASTRTAHVGPRRPGDPPAWRIYGEPRAPALASRRRPGRPVLGRLTNRSPRVSARLIMPRRHPCGRGQIRVG